MFEKNLKYYRLKKKMSMKELAEACGVTSMAISNYESGKRKPDMDMINTLAKALGVHVVDFVSSRNTKLSFKHCEFRKHSSLTKSQQDYVRESIEEYFSRFFDAVDCICGNPLPEPLKPYVLDRTGNCELDARNLKEYLGIQLEGPVNGLTAILENKGILIQEIEIDNPHFFGMNGFVNDYPYIVINSSMRPERKRTTIVHELSHLMFKWDEDKEKENEKEATCIAGAFLISEKDIIRELGIHKSSITKDMNLVCEEYGISLYLLVKRASICGVISESLEKEFYIWANKSNLRKTEPSRVKITEKPLLFRQIVYMAVNEEGLSLSRGAELLKVPVNDLKQFCGKVEA